eukprot:8030761-Pyramimonas_sp.AAC.1
METRSARPSRCSPALTNVRRPRQAGAAASQGIEGATRTAPPKELTSTPQSPRLRVAAAARA